MPKRQGRLGQDGAADGHRRIHDDGRNGVREDVANDAEVAGTHGAGRVDVVVLA